MVQRITWHPLCQLPSHIPNMFHLSSFHQWKGKKVMFTGRLIWRCSLCDFFFFSTLICQRKKRIVVIAGAAHRNTDKCSRHLCSSWNCTELHQTGNSLMLLCLWCDYHQYHHVSLHTDHLTEPTEKSCWLPGVILGAESVNIGSGGLQCLEDPYHSPETTRCHDIVWERLIY